MIAVFTAIGSIAGLLASAVLLKEMLRRQVGKEVAGDLAELIDWMMRLLNTTVPVPRPPFAGGQPPSIVSAIIGLAVRRLPESLAPAEKERWAEEMAADVAAVPGRLRRLIFAFRLWRKGAPGMPVGAVDAPRSADS